jgi:PDZ domain-containing protein
MIEVDPAYRHPYAGSFLLTTVSTQTPILLGQWLEALFDPTTVIVPAEQVVPADITPQEQVRLYAGMLEESEALATVVGLRQAGYAAAVRSTAVEIMSIVPESVAHGIIEPGDWIVAANGVPITTTQGLRAQLLAQPARDAAELEIKRADQPLRVTVPLLPPAAPGEPPRIGITVQTIGFAVDLPFPVRIEPHKIGGGPSAGLMFALTVYNLVTPDDLTRGHQVAGTGTIALDGTVGPIGGVAQKVAGAELAGAEYFLAPAENYEQARAAARRIKVVRVASIDEAIAFLRGLAA